MEKQIMNAKGFTLVELMVVVAIIGILSSVAVPNFKKYQAKAKQSEAKVQLASLYTVEVGALADYDTYATCLTDLGYNAPGAGYYLVGFSASVATTVSVVTNAGGTCSTAFSANPLTFKHGGGAVPTTTDLAAGVLSSGAFTAVAAGQISTSLTTNDVWTITDSQVLKNVTIGL